MKKLLSICLALFITSAASAQILFVKDGEGRIGDGRVFANKEFRVQKNGSWNGGTPERWTAGIGTVNGNLVDDYVSNISKDIILERAVDGDALGVVSAQGDPSFYGLSRFITICDQSVDAIGLTLCDEFGDPISYSIRVTTMGSTSPSKKVRILNSSGTPIDSATNSNTFNTFTVSSQGTYTVEVNYLTTTECQGGTLEVSVDVHGCTLGRSANSEGNVNAWEANNVALYPNPSAGDRNITVQIAEDLKGFDMMVLDAQGRVVKTAPVTGMKSNLYVGDLKQGIYFIKFDTNKYVGARRLIID